MIPSYRAWRRRRILARNAIPEALWAQTLAAVPRLARLDAGQQSELRRCALLFLHEKRVEPAVGMQLDDAMRLRIALLACELILNLGLDWYEGFVSVIVYPNEFLVRNREVVDEAGVVHTADDWLCGEAWEQGPVILAWEDVQASGRGEGFDVVAHEFAHKLDLLEGSMNGMPPLHAGMRAADWVADFEAAYEALLAELDAGREPWLDPYAAESPAEFFAVSVEMFFDLPGEFRRHYPALYARLATFFRQQP